MDMNGNFFVRILFALGWLARNHKGGLFRQHGPTAGESLFLLERIWLVCCSTRVKIIRTPQEMQDWSRTNRREGRTIGLVPTMGYLHDGHMALVSIAREHADLVVLSIFVNPTQFGPNEDFNRYPRDLARDERRCADAGVDVVFYPEVAMMYAEDHSVFVIEETLALGLCGTSRPGHFRGVVTVVAKLFNVALPDIAVFGEKDAQQLRVIRRLVRDLNFPVTIIPGPIVREPDGLAMSSRNVRLSPEERNQAVHLSRSLAAANDAFAGGVRNADQLKAVVRNELARASSARIDYVELVDDETLEPVNEINRNALLAVAVYFSGVRLIDNVVLKV